MHTLAVVDGLDPAGRAEVEALLRDVATATGHSPLADGKLVMLHGRGKGFAVLAREQGSLSGLGVGVLTEPGAAVWNVQEAVRPTAASGLREELARRVLEEARARGAVRVQWWAVEAGEEDDVLAGRLGLAPWRDIVQMRRPLPIEERPQLPEGITLRSFVPGDDEAEWLEVNRRAFSEHPEQGTFTEADLRARSAEEWFDPEDFLVAENGLGQETAASGMAGFCWVKVPDSTHGEIYVIGVDPRCQGSGLGRALVVAGMRRMVEKGVPEARLYVDGANKAGLALYESLGFSSHHVDRAYAVERQAAVRDSSHE